MHTAQQVVAAERPINSANLPNPFKRSSVKKRFTRLMDQQFWLWGCDARRAEGNLLMECGFDKVRPPEGAPVRISRYTRQMCQEQTIVLWSFGIAIDDVDRGVLVLPRFGFRPRCGECGIDLSSFWDPKDFDVLPSIRETCDHEQTWTLLADLLRWIAEYEREVMDLAGLAYRRNAVKAWKRPVEPAAELYAMWSDLAQAVRPVPSYSVASRRSFQHAVSASPSLSQRP